MTYRIKLGQEVRDNITGFQGVATARTLWLHGCERILVQPPFNKKEQKLPEAHTFDEPQLEIIGDGVLIDNRPPAYGDNTYVPTQH